MQSVINLQSFTKKWKEGVLHFFSLPEKWCWQGATNLGWMEPNGTICIHTKYSISSFKTSVSTKEEKKNKHTIASRHLFQTIVAAVVRAGDHTGPRHSRSDLRESIHLYWSKDSKHSAPASLSHPHLTGIPRAWHWSSLDVQQVGGCCMSTWKILVFRGCLVQWEAQSGHPKNIRK